MNLSEIYNRFAATYEENRELFDVSDIFDEFYAELGSASGNVLDLGCGAGEPFARWFVARGWNVTGVDFSDKMVELAQKYVPQMNSICADMTYVDFDKSTFDAITAVYSLFHVPRERHLALFRKWHTWLKPAGKVLFTYATHEYTGAKEFDGYKEFLGEQLFYSHDTEQIVDKKLQRSGFIIYKKQKRIIGGETFLWITAKRH